MKANKAWSAEDLDFLRSYLGLWAQGSISTYSVALQGAKALGRTYSAVRAQFYLLRKAEPPAKSVHPQHRTLFVKDSVQAELLKRLVFTAYRLWAKGGLSWSGPGGRHPKVGDFVMEISTIAFRAMDAGRVGKLLRVHEGRNGKTWTLRMLDGRQQRWNNADFIALPEGWCDGE